MAEPQDGRSLGQRVREIPVPQEPRSPFTFTLVTKGLFVTEAAITLGDAEVAISHFRGLTESALPGIAVLIPVLLAMKPRAGVS